MNSFNISSIAMSLVFILGHVSLGLVVSCGAQPEAEPKSSPLPEPRSDINYAEDPKEVVVEYRKEGKDKIEVFELTKDLPKCSSAKDGKVAFVRQEDKFFECEEDRWMQVILDETEASKVKSEAKTTPSPSPSPTVSPSASPLPVSASVWVDPISGKKWVVGGQAAFRIAETTCGASYRLPNRDEALAANNRGVRTAFPNVSLTSFWINELDLAASTTSVYVLKVTPVVAIATALMTETHSILCIEK